MIRSTTMVRTMNLRQRLQARKREKKRQFLYSMHIIQLIFVICLACGLLVHEINDEDTTTTSATTTTNPYHHPYPYQYYHDHQYETITTSKRSSSSSRNNHFGIHPTTTTVMTTPATKNANHLRVAPSSSRNQHGNENNNNHNNNNNMHDLQVPETRVVTAPKSSSSFFDDDNNYNDDKKKIDSIARAYPKWGATTTTTTGTRTTDRHKDHLPLVPSSQKDQDEPYRWCPLVPVSSNDKEKEKEKHGGLLFVPTDDNNDNMMMIDSATRTSSVGVSITLNIAYQVGQRKLQYQQESLFSTIRNSTKTNTTTITPEAMCHVQYFDQNHDHSYHPHYRNKESFEKKTQLFKWTIVQEPIIRARNVLHYLDDRIGHVNNNNDKADDNDDNSQSLQLHYLNQSMNIQYNQLIKVQDNNNTNIPKVSQQQLRHQWTKKETKKNDTTADQKRIVVHPLSNIYPQFHHHHPHHHHYDNTMYEVVQKEILQQYDFIAVADRLHESLVVLKFLLDLDHIDILVLLFEEEEESSKTQQQSSSSSGGWWYNPYYYDDDPQRRNNENYNNNNNDGNHHPNNVCALTLKSSLSSSYASSSSVPTSPTVRSYLETIFINPNYNIDNLVYQAASQSLDLTIDTSPAIIGGRIGFEAVLQEHLGWQSLVKEYCTSTTIPSSSSSIQQKGPCSSTGIYQPKEAINHCYSLRHHHNNNKETKDNYDDDEDEDFLLFGACGHACIEKVWQTSEGNLTRATALVEAWRRERRGGEQESSY